MKKVLIISYYWPPAAGAGVQRWLKFCKYLRQFGWEPIVYTPENPENPGTDNSLAGDIPENILVLRIRIMEPYRFYKMLTGRPATEKVQAGFLSEHKKPGMAERVATWLRGNLFIPDARKWWIKPSIKYLRKWLENHPVDAIVSTGPPHSMHLIAMGLKQSTGIPWLADFRDPWTQIDFYHRLMLTRLADTRHKKLEKMVLENADCVLTVSDHCALGLQEISGKNIDVITNGFDAEDFKDIPPFDYAAFSITHLGSMNADRNPIVLWEVLAELIQEDPFFSKHLRIRFIGKTDVSVFERLAASSLQSYVENLSYLPHDQAIREAARSAVLLLPLNNTPNVLGIAPGKMYEYLALNRPILGIGPIEGDAAKILFRTNSGIMCGFSDADGIKQSLLDWKKQFLSNTLDVSNLNMEAYSRKNLTQSLATLLDGILT